MQTKSDDQLIEDFLDGDTRAFGHIVERHRTRLTYVARRYTHNEHDAQDIVQEAFLKASTSLNNYRRDAQLYTWLHRLVLNAGYDHLNHRANRTNPSLDSGDFDPERNPALATASTSDISDLRMILEEALAQLGKEQRDAFYLTEVEGYTLADVAAVQGVRLGTVKSRRARAKAALRETISHAL